MAGYGGADKLFVEATPTQHAHYNGVCLIIVAVALTHGVMPRSCPPRRLAQPDRVEAHSGNDVFEVGDAFEQICVHAPGSSMCGYFWRRSSRASALSVIIW